MNAHLPKSALLALALMASGALFADSTPPIPVKVMIVSTYEVGEDTGDQPGEYQFWVEREHLDTVVPFSFAHRHLRTNGKGVYAFISGTMTPSGTSILALVLDSRFDFTHTYWIINGIAGIDPLRGSLGSAAWAQWIINGDIAMEVDSSEKKPGWPYGIHACPSNEPNQLPKEYKVPLGPDDGHQRHTMAFKLNPDLVQWAYGLTKDTKIPDNEGMKQYRAQYVGYPNAQKPPFVLIGDCVSTARYYYGKVMNQWAEDWDKLWTDGKGSYAMSACEDQAIAYTLLECSKQGKVDWNRVLFLRTASDFAFAAPGKSAQENLESGFPGYIPALEAAYGVGSRVLHEIVTHWATYESSIPTATVRAVD
jgi:purine nucleoside permease